LSFGDWEELLSYKAGGCADNMRSSNLGKLFCLKLIILKSDEIISKLGLK
jgi:hypothetical protein